MFAEKDFKSAVEADQIPDAGSIGYRSPSNIALVKYWGKFEPQLPANPSISFTLDHCRTQTELRFERSTKGDGGFKVFFEGEENQAFRPKISAFFDRIGAYLPFLDDYAFEIHTSNSFPHSSGIASSASGMSALASCLVAMESLERASVNEEFLKKKSSFLARLGSGSACRSIEGPIVVWGAHEKISGSSDLYGTPLATDIHSVFSDYQDSILLVDKGQKQVSSTVGHALMDGHPYAAARFEQANEHMSRMIAVLENGELDDFITLVESEALSLHAMMMSSQPYFLLMRPNTLRIIESIWAYRRSTDSKLCFTLDAGANVHLLYPSNEKAAVIDFIQSELAKYCQEGHFIEDRVGLGAQRITKE